MIIYKVKSLHMKLPLCYNSLDFLNERSTCMTWKTVNIHMMKGDVFAVYGDSALFFRQDQYLKDLNCKG